MSADAGLAIVAREPLAGNCKTRLVPALTAAAAAELYHCFLRDFFLTAAQVAAAEVVVCYADPGGEGFFRGAALPGFRLRAQPGGDLGQRLAGLAQGLLAEYPAVLLTSSDSPNLPLSYLEEAVRACRTADVVLGPAEDGGYYLIGMRRFHPEPFAGIPWSTAAVLATTLARCEQARLDVKLLPAWYDVDDPGGLARLAADVLGPRPAGSPCPHTAWMLQRLGVA